MIAQLYSMRSIELPDSAMLLADGPKILTVTFPACPYMYWPDGTVCEILNMYFIDIAHLATGDSLKTAASELSHIVRYCWKQRIPIAGLQDANIFEFVKLLKEEKAPRRANEHARNNNTIRSILRRTIRFLFWYQKNFISPTSIPLIGLKEDSPQIKVSLTDAFIPYQAKSSAYYTHGAMPPPESTNPKGPIAQTIIESIEKCIDDLAAVETQRPKFIQRYRNQPDLMLARLNYVRIRRHFLVWIMKRTGLRPSEMGELSVKEHENILQTKRFLIPSKKRRRHTAPMRSFPITLKDASVYQRYAAGRVKFYDALESSGMTVDRSDALFLSVEGAPIKTSSLQREFARLVRAAGFQDVQACLSMFRHRFITYEVIVHLKEFMANSGKTKHLMTETDCMSILKRVATKTGHGSARSLWNYIDLAWQEINVWGSIDKALSRLHAADRLYDDMRELQHELENIKVSAFTKKVLAEFTSRLGSILQSANAELKGDSVQ